MQTCATCRFFFSLAGKTATLMATSEKVQVGDCRRYPPKHILNVLTASEHEKDKDEQGLVEVPRTAREYAGPFYWMLVPEYANAYDGTNAMLWCGEHEEKLDAETGNNGTGIPSSE